MGLNQFPTFCCKFSPYNFEGQTRTLELDTFRFLMTVNSIITGSTLPPKLIIFLQLNYNYPHDFQ